MAYGSGARGTHFKGIVQSALGFIADAGGVTATAGGLTATAGGAAITGGTVTDTIAVGSGTTINKIIRGTVAIDFASCADKAIVEASVTVTGAAVGDTVIMNPPAAGMTAGLGLVGASVSATNTIKVRIANLSGGTVDEASATWSYMLVR